MAEQIVLPFRMLKRQLAAKTPAGHRDLIGDSYFDGVSDVIVTGISPSNPNHVTVKRESDNKQWTVPAGLIRLIMGHKKRRRRIA